MITFFTIPKPFEGHVGIIQRNALRSWKCVDPGVQLLVLGETDAAVDTEHVRGVRCNAHGTPLLDDAFRISEERARYDVLCYANADILLPPTIRRAVGAAASRSPFLIVGESWNVRIDEELDAIPSHAAGKRRGADALDYFVFTRGLFAELPPFAVGRTVWDNWLVWHACRRGATVVDATWEVHALHQDHAYTHGDGLAKIRTSPEALENRRLSGGGRERLYSRFDASHRLLGGQLVPNPLRVGHLGETLRRGWAKAGYATGLRSP